MNNITTFSERFHNWFRPRHKEVKQYQAKSRFGKDFGILELDTNYASFLQYHHGYSLIEVK